MNQPFLESLIAFKTILAESDEELRKLERAAKASPGDKTAHKAYNTALKRAGQPTLDKRTGPDLTRGAEISRARSDKVGGGYQDQDRERISNYPKHLRRLNTKFRSLFRGHELEARAKGDKRAEVATGRTRKLLRLAAKHDKTLPAERPPGRFTSTDNKHHRLSYLAARAEHQAVDLARGRRVGTGFKDTQNPERSALVNLSSRTRRQHQLPGWKASEEAPATRPLSVTPTHTRIVCQNTLSNALCRKKEEPKPIRHTATQHLKQAAERLSKKVIKKQTEAEEPLKHECAWCGQHTGGPADAKKVSHGICQPCKDKFFPGVGSKKPMPGVPKI